MKSFKQLLEAAGTVSYTEINKLTEMFLKNAQKVMKSKKFKQKRSKSSANFEIKWVKGKEDYALDGWHGDGKYGDLMLAMELYKGYDSTDIFVFSDRKGQYMPGMPTSSEENSNYDSLTKKEFKEYKENLKKAMDYINNI